VSVYGTVTHSTHLMDFLGSMASVNSSQP
jgi:hypothetical protein